MPAAVVVRRVLGHGGKNWVTETPVPDATLGGQGALPKYISFIAGRLHENGHPTSEAIALAVAACKRWARGGTHVTPIVRARAAAALAEWEAKRAKSDLSNPLAYDTARNALPGSAPWTTPMLVPDLQHSALYRSNRAQVGTMAKGKTPAALRQMAAKHAGLAETARKAGDQKTYAHHAGIATGLLDAAQAQDGNRTGVQLSNGGPMETVTEGMHVYDPQGAERDEVSRTVKGIDALKRRGSTKQANSLEAALVRGKTSRARKMPDGSVRAHTAVEVQAGLARLRKGTTNLSSVHANVIDLDWAEWDKEHGWHDFDKDSKVSKLAKATGHAGDLDKLKKVSRDSFTKGGSEDEAKKHEKMAAALVQQGNHGAALEHLATAHGIRQSLGQSTNLSGGRTMRTVDLAMDTAKMFPDAASVKKAAAKLGKLPPPLRKRLASMLAQRAKALGISVELANEAARTIDLALPQAQRDAARKAGFTFPGTTSYPLAGMDGKFTRRLAGVAVRMVGLGNVASKAAIRRWLVGKLKANGCADLVPQTWPEGKS